MLKPGLATANEHIKGKGSPDITATFSLNPVCTESHNLASIKEPISKQQDAVHQAYASYTILIQNYKDGQMCEMPNQECMHTNSSLF